MVSSSTMLNPREHWWSHRIFSIRAKHSLDIIRINNMDKGDSKQIVLVNGAIFRE